MLKIEKMVKGSPCTVLYNYSISLKLNKKFILKIFFCVWLPRCHYWWKKHTYNAEP